MSGRFVPTPCCTYDSTGMIKSVHMKSVGSFVFLFIYFSQQKRQRRRIPLIQQLPPIVSPNSRKWQLHANRSTKFKIHYPSDNVRRTCSYRKRDCQDDGTNQSTRTLNSQIPDRFEARTVILRV